MHRCVSSCAFVFFLLFLLPMGATEAADVNTPNFSSVTWLNAYHETFDTLDTSQIISTSDGGYMLAGDGGGLLKLDGLGNVQWQRVYYCCGYSDPFGLSGVVEVPEGYFAVGASRLESGSGILAVGLDKNGEVIWSKRYVVQKYNSAGKVIRTRDGGYLIAGSTANTQRDRRTLLLKLGGGGAIQWQKTYNVRPVTSIAQLSNGDLLFSTDQFSVLRTNSHGNVRWQRKYSGRGCCGQGTMAVLADGGFFLAGYMTYQAPDGAVSVLVLKADPSGKILLSKRFRATGQFTEFDIEGMIGTLDGGVTIYAHKRDFTNPNRTTLISVDGNGNLSWRKEYFYRPVGGFFFASALHQTSDGGYLLAGVRSWLAKLDASGSIYCKNIMRSAPTTVLDYPITFERHFPNVVSTHAAPENEPVTSTPLMPVVEKVCAPN